MASCLQKIPSENESRARKEKMMKWVFETLAKDCDWKSCKLPGIDFFNSFIVTNWRLHVCTDKSSRTS